MRVTGVRRTSPLAVFRRAAWGGAAFGAGAILLAVAGAARADEGLTLQAGVQAMTDEGRPVGCQATFGVGRRATEDGGGSSLAMGSLAIMQVGGKAKVALKFGVLDAQAADSGEPGADRPKAPVRAVLLEDGGDPQVDNGADALGAPLTEDGFGVFLFDPGPVTRQVLAQAARNGRFKIRYTLRPDGPPARLVVDVTVAKRDLMASDNTVIDDAARATLAKCLGQVLK